MIENLRESKEEQALVVKRLAKEHLIMIDQNSTDLKDILKRLALIEVYIGLRDP